MVKQLFSKSEIEGFGFKYEPNPSKCQTTKIKCYFQTFNICKNKSSLTNGDYKACIAKSIPWKYVNSVFIDDVQLREQPDGWVSIKGHTFIDII